MIRPRPTSTLFPYTTLFRSVETSSCPRYTSGVGTLKSFEFSGVTVHRRLPENSKDRKSTRLNSSHVAISYAVFCLKKKKKILSQRVNLLQMAHVSFVPEAGH